MSAKIDGLVSKASQGVKGLTWVFGPKDEWHNDRVEFGPFTTKTEDKQRERVFLNKDRLEFIFKHGHLLYEHHHNSAEPVIILGDCLGIAVDGFGKSYGLWGWYSGSETIDKKWEESQTFGEGMGYSIGGKRTNVICSDKICTLDNPEVLEVSKVKNPANTECTVFFINQFAKSLIDRSKAGESAHEFHIAVNRFKKKMEDTYKLDPTYDPSFDHYWNTHPCVVDYIRGAEEMGVKKSEAIDMFNDLKETIRKQVTKMSEDKIDKEQMAPPQPQTGATPPQPGASGNQTLDLLNRILMAIEALASRGGATQGQPPSPGAGAEKGDQPPPPGAGGEEGDSKPPEEDDEEKKKKDVKKAEASLNLPDGKKDKEKGPNPEGVDGNSKVSSTIALPDGENPTPPGPNPKNIPKPADRGEKGKEDTNAMPGLGQNVSGVSTKIPSQNYESTTVGKAVPKTPTLKQIMGAQGFVMVKHDSRTEKSYDDPKAQAPLDGKSVEPAVQKSGTGLFDQIKQNKFVMRKSH